MRNESEEKRRGASQHSLDLEKRAVYVYEGHRKPSVEKRR